MPGVELVAAPCSRGLRPPARARARHVVGAGGAALGRARRVPKAGTPQAAHPAYDFQKQLGTRIRNGITIREHGVPAELHADRASQCPSRC
jgi:arginase